MTPITQKSYVAGHVGVPGLYLVCQLTKGHSNAAPFIAREARQTITQSPICRDYCKGDVRHSQAYNGKARRLLAYMQTHTFKQCIELAMPWFVQ